MLMLSLAVLAGISPAFASAAGQDAWGKANTYMIEELQEAQSLGIIPGSIIGTDFTKPITRAEFAHLVVLMCETYTGVSTEPLMLAGNPFTDADDPDIFKAYGLGIIDGANPEGTMFSPDGQLDRETVAFMLYRAIRLIAPKADYNVSETAAIPDKGQISEWALQPVLYLYSRGIILGYNNMFMPRPVTDAQKASDYGIATREQCVVLATRLYKLLPEIQDTRFSVEDKAAEIMGFAMDELQDGAEIDRDELISLLRPYSNKVRWAENMNTAIFLGDFRKIGDGEWEQGYDSALLFSDQSYPGDNGYKYDEEVTLWGAFAGRSRFSLASFDADSKLLTVSEWNSDSDTGDVIIRPSGSANWFSHLGLTYYMPARLTWVYKAFDDMVINGELCKVFSATRDENLIQSDEGPPIIAPPSGLTELTDYYFISTVSGLCVLQSNYATLRDTTYLSIQVIFNWAPSLTDVSLIEPPPDIILQPVSPPPLMP